MCIRGWVLYQRSRPSTLTLTTRSTSAGCEQSFATREALLQHHSSKKHQDDTLRRAILVESPPESRPPLPPLPEVVPAYMSVSRWVSRHPITKERHQWLGPKVSVQLRFDSEVYTPKRYLPKLPHFYDGDGGGDAHIVQIE